MVRSMPSRFGRRGSSTVEFALMMPIIVVLILWSNYFWEIQMARIKAAEVARFVAFERTVRTDVAGIASEAKDRYQDLNGADRVSTGGKTAPPGYQNAFTLKVTAKDVDAPLTTQSIDTKGGGGLGSVMGKVVGAIGSGLEEVIGLMKFRTDKGAVQVDVEMTIQNRIIPLKIVDYVARKDSEAKLDITFREKFYIYHDTWKAWHKGNNPKDTYNTVQRNVANRMPDIAYLGLASIDGVDGILEVVGKVLDVLQLDWPLRDSYTKDTTLIRKVKDNGRYNAQGPTRTVPGDQLRAAYWKQEWLPCTHKGCLPNARLKKKYGYDGGKTPDADQNWPMRAYNCRGPYFQGATKSDALEYDYATNAGTGKKHFNMAGQKACIAN